MPNGNVYYSCTATPCIHVGRGPSNVRTSTKIRSDKRKQHCRVHKCGNCELVHYKKW
jgi:hypothetical protein